MTDPTSPDWMRQGLELQQAKRFAEAEAVYRQVLAGDPNNAHAIHLIGVIAGQTGRLPEAVQLIERSIALLPDIPVFHNNFGEALWETGQAQKAIEAWKRSLELKSDYPTSHMNMARACETFGAFEAAQSHYQRVIEIQPSNLAAHNKLANVLARRGELAKAVAIWEAIVAADPQNPTARINAGAALAKVGRLPEAMVHLDKAVQLAPSAVPAHMNRGMALLEAGNFAEGFRECDWYWRGLADGSHRNFGKPAWDGSPLAGRTILLYTDHGADDAIQWARFAPFLAERGGKVILECHPDLLRLFKSIKGIQAVARGETLPAFDTVCELARIPAILGLDKAALVARMPYISPYKSTFQTLRDELTRMGPKRKVGLAWSLPARPHRSAPPFPSLTAFAPLLARADLIFVNLQTGPARQEISTVYAANPIVDWTSRFKDPSDFAAIIGCLDLLITIDSPMAHVGGAMARRVWTMLPAEGANWRWGLTRDDTWWYPKMRLFRQKVTGDWDEVVKRINAGIAVQ